MAREIRQEVEDRIAVPCQGVSRDPNPPQEVRGSLRIPATHLVHGPPSGLDTSSGTAWAEHLVREPLVLPGDESGPTSVDIAQKDTGTQVTILYPKVPRVHGLKHRSEQGALLRMAIFTGQDIGYQALSRFIDDQRLARERPGLQGT